ncbi:hypothetical protein [Actinomadura violacea]|uniref:Antitoxin n=1 Tax=Actinomadura violacea TaxID=2819934 RepID=A0ABS3S054_9ACTN|nr:hypothetical protein [Actinomadura violacea]MBO2461679.1 hypothetical protein [Actinomadura violacea]
MDERVRIDGSEITEAIRDARGGHPKIVSDHEGNEAVVISRDAYEELERLRLEAQRRAVRERLSRADAGEPARVFTDANEMFAVAAADRRARNVA